MHVKGSEDFFSLVALVGPLEKFMYDLAQGLLVEFENESLESLDHGRFDLVKLGNINLCILLIVVVSKIKRHLEELGNFSEPFFTEVLFHVLHQGL